jgi:hypothetical protein
LIFVLAIWGAVIYKIFFQKAGIGTHDLINNSFIPESIDLSSLNDTFSIHANYRDPFLGKTVEAGGEQKKVTAFGKPIAVTGKWPQIEFHGLIKNQKSNKQIALIQIDGHGYNMMPGNTEKGIELRHLYKDSVELFFNKERKVVKK